MESLYQGSLGRGQGAWERTVRKWRACGENREGTGIIGNKKEFGSYGRIGEGVRAYWASL